MGLREDQEALVPVVNGLSDDAVYMVSRDWFGQLILGKAVLAAPMNKRQEKIFDELMEVGFVYIDTERGSVGFRSTDRGRLAHPICVAAREGPSNAPPAS